MLALEDLATRAVAAASAAPAVSPEMTWHVEHLLEYGEWDLAASHALHALVDAAVPVEPQLLADARKHEGWLLDVSDQLHAALAV